MTNGTACPDESLFSQFLDHELEAAEEKQIARHLATCPKCRARVARMGQTEGIARTRIPVLRRRFSLFASPLHCPSPEKVTAYMQGLLAAEEDLQIEQHLHTCDACLQEAKETSRVLFFLASLREEQVPVSLQAQVARQWETPPAEEHRLSLPRLVIQMTQQGLHLIESYLAPPLLSVQEVLVPPSAYRGGERSFGLSFLLHTEETEIAVLAVPEEDRVAVTLTLLDPERKALADRRVFLRRQGRAIFSEKTDQQGVLHVPRLEPGDYEVACHELHTTFLLELRP